MQLSPHVVPGQLPISRSRYLRAYYAVVAMLASLVLAQAALPLICRMLAMTVMALYLQRCWRREFGAERVDQLAWRSSSWFLRIRGDWQTAELDGAVVWPLLLVIRFRLQGKVTRRYLVLPVDALGSEQHRQLRVLLRYWVTA